MHKNQDNDYIYFKIIIDDSVFKQLSNMYMTTITLLQQWKEECLSNVNKIQEQEKIKQGLQKVKSMMQQQTQQIAEKISTINGIKNINDSIVPSRMQQYLQQETEDIINLDTPNMLNLIIFSINYYTEVYIYLYKIYKHVSYDQYKKNEKNISKTLPSIQQIKIHDSNKELKKEQQIFEMIKMIDNIWFMRYSKRKSQNPIIIPYSAMQSHQTSKTLDEQLKLNRINGYKQILQYAESIIYEIMDKQIENITDIQKSNYALYYELIQQNNWDKLQEYSKIEQQLTDYNKDLSQKIQHFNDRYGFYIQQFSENKIDFSNLVNKQELQQMIDQRFENLQQQDGSEYNVRNNSKDCFGECQVLNKSGNMQNDLLQLQLLIKKTVKNAEQQIEEYKQDQLKDVEYQIEAIKGNVLQYNLALQQTNKQSLEETQKAILEQYLPKQLEETKEKIKMMFDGNEDMQKITQIYIQLQIDKFIQDTQNQIASAFELEEQNIQDKLEDFIKQQYQTVIDKIVYLEQLEAQNQNLYTQQKEENEKLLLQVKQNNQFSDTFQQTKLQLYQSQLLKNVNEQNNKTLQSIQYNMQQELENYKGELKKIIEKQNKQYKDVKINKNFNIDTQDINLIIQQQEIKYLDIISQYKGAIQFFQEQNKERLIKEKEFDDRIKTLEKNIQQKLNDDSIDSNNTVNIIANEQKIIEAVTKETRYIIEQCKQQQQFNLLQNQDTQQLIELYRKEISIQNQSIITNQQIQQQIQQQIAIEQNKRNLVTKQLEQQMIELGVSKGEIENYMRNFNDTKIPLNDLLQQFQNNVKQSDQYKDQILNYIKIVQQTVQDINDKELLIQQQINGNNTFQQELSKQKQQIDSLLLQNDQDKIQLKTIIIDLLQNQSKLTDLQKEIIKNNDELKLKQETIIQQKDTVQFMIGQNKIEQQSVLQLKDEVINLLKQSNIQRDQMQELLENISKQQLIIDKQLQEIQQGKQPKIDEKEIQKLLQYIKTDETFKEQQNKRIKELEDKLKHIDLQRFVIDQNKVIQQNNVQDMQQLQKIIEKERQQFENLFVQQIKLLMFNQSDFKNLKDQLQNNIVDQTIQQNIIQQQQNILQQQIDQQKTELKQKYSGNSYDQQFCQYAQQCVQKKIQQQQLQNFIFTGVISAVLININLLYSKLI